MTRTPEEIQEALSLGLRQARAKAGLSQRALAEKIGVTQASVMSWEKGDRRLRIDQAVAYAQACGITVQRLLAALDSAWAGLPTATTPTLRGRDTHIPARQVGPADGTADSPDVVVVDAGPSGPVTGRGVGGVPGSHGVGVDEVAVRGADETDERVCGRHGEPPAPILPGMRTIVSNEFASPSEVLP